MDRVVLYPYPDLKRIWTRVWLSALQEEKPNLEIVIYNPDGSRELQCLHDGHTPNNAPRRRCICAIRSRAPPIMSSPS